MLIGCRRMLHSRSIVRLENGDRHLLALVDAATGAAAALAGPHLVCHPGCTPCCVGPFPISQLDAWRLQGGLRVLDARDPLRASALRRRAAAQVDAQRAVFPGDAVGTFHDEGAGEEAFLASAAAVPCPALDPSTGTCDLYEWRPVACRTYGPPLRLGARDLPHCGLCFTAATADEIEAARQRLDVAALEQPMTDEVEAGTHRFGATTVAFAIACPPGR
jgi:Fe-S-cluster containining protein